MRSTSQGSSFSHLEDLRSAYDRDAKHRNGIDDLQWRPAVLEEWLAELPRAPRLLELGPGTGQLAAFVQSLGASVHAVDLSPENVAYCRQRGVSAQVGDLRALDAVAALGVFDGVYAINALLHVPRVDHANVIAGVRQHLAPGGGLLIVSWGGHAREGIWEGDWFQPPRFFSQYDHESFQALTFDGFEVVRREVLAAQAPDGARPQLLALRKLADAAEPPPRAGRVRSTPGP